MVQMGYNCKLTRFNFVFRGTLPDIRYKFIGSFGVLEVRSESSLKISFFNVQFYDQHYC